MNPTKEQLKAHMDDFLRRCGFELETELQPRGNLGLYRYAGRRVVLYRKHRVISASESYDVGIKDDHLARIRSEVAGRADVEGAYGYGCWHEEGEEYHFMVCGLDVLASLSCVEKHERSPGQKLRIRIAHCPADAEGLYHYTRFAASLPGSEEQERRAAEEILGSGDPRNTQARAWANRRIGQDAFKRKLLGRTRACELTGLTCTTLLRASHIKPWAEATDEERLDEQNGLLLAPNVDAAFDRGLISFSDTGEVLYASGITREQARQMGIEGTLVRTPGKRMRAYLAYHRKRYHFA